jgi:uncharacterized protein (DUF1330 family)
MRERNRHMTYEMIVGLTVADDAEYRQYRTEMTPLLHAAGGGFRYDFVVAKVLQSASDHPINRVFAIHFPDRRAKDAFFADARYLAVRGRHFDRAVTGRTTIAEYDR